MLSIDRNNATLQISYFCRDMGYEWTKTNKQGSLYTSNKS